MRLGSIQTLRLMRDFPRFAQSALLAVILGGCAPSVTVDTAPPSSHLLGTWAEIITTSPANPIDGRQMIERSANGTFRLVFVKTYPAQPACVGRWSVSGATYVMSFSSVTCFSAGASKPAIGVELKLELTESSTRRLRFNVPDGVPLAAWQAKLEGGIE